MRSVQKVSSHALWKIETFTEDDTRYKKHCTQDTDISVPFKAGTLAPHTVLQIAISCSVIFPQISWMVWNFFPFKAGFSFGEKLEVAGHQIWAIAGLHHLSDLIVCQKLYIRCDAWAGTLSWWSSQSPVAHGCGLLNHANSFCWGMFKLNTKCDGESLLYSLSHFECDSHTVHMLTQWSLPPLLTSTVRSSLFAHVQSTLLGCQVTSVLCKLFSLY